MKPLITILSLILLLSSFGNNWLKKLNAARDKYVSRNYSEAWELYNQISNQEIDNQIAAEKAQTAFRIGNYQQAIQLYKSAIKQDNKREMASILHYNLAICYTQINVMDEAIFHYKESIRLQPTKAAKHNLLLLKNKEKEESFKQKEESSPINETENWDFQSNRGTNNSIYEENTTLHERKMEKQLDELQRLDALTKKKVSRRITIAPKKQNQKDW